MMLFIISFCAFLASFLTFFSGFGLGTLLMPVVAIFFPVAVAIAITALVHLLTNIFKLILLRKNINWPVTLKFGLPAVVAAIPGAWLLSYLSKLPTVFSYSFLHFFIAHITPVKIITGVLLIIFATLEWRTIGKSAFFKAKWLPVGGLLSGFFGGLSGQQGAFRTPFLLHAELSKEQFVGTNSAIAILVDASRLLVYGATFSRLLEYQLHFFSLITLIIAAFLGTAIGVVYLKKITFDWIQYLVVILLYLLGVLLILGVI